MPDEDILNNLSNISQLTIILYVFIDFIKYYSLSKEMNTLSKYKHATKYNKKIIKSHLNNNKIVKIEGNKKNRF